MTQQHPAAWWLAALSLATSVAAINHGGFSATAAVVSVAVGFAFAYSEQARKNFRFICIGMAVLVAVRVLLQNLFGYPMGANVLFTLPSADMPMWLSGLRLGGSVTSESVLFALNDGTRIAAITLAFVSAATVTSPTRVLRALPLAMHNVGMVVVIAVTFLPHLLADLSRVRHASRWRGQQVGGLRQVMAQIINVAESALDRSVTLAAALTLRGFTQTRSHHRWVLLLGATASIGFGFALMLLGMRWNLLAGFAFSLVALWLGLGRSESQQERTRYRQSVWKKSDLAIAATPLISAASYAVVLATTRDMPSALASAMSLLVVASAVAAARAPRFRSFA